MQKSYLGPSIFAELGRPVVLRSWAGLLVYATDLGSRGCFLICVKELEPADLDSG
jgi:hypothetical protein